MVIPNMVVKAEACNNCLMHFFLTYLKTWKAGIRKSLEKKRHKLRLFSSKKVIESEETSLVNIKVALCVTCGDWIPTKSPMLHCRACKNRNDFDVYELAGFKKVEEIRIEY